MPFFLVTWGRCLELGPSCTAAPLSTSPHFTECDGPAWKSVKVLCKNTSCVMLKSASRCKMREAAVPLIPFVVLCLLSLSQAARQGQDIRCGACRALVDELEWAISQIDPKKMIQTGSFRINPDGSQSFREVPLARSEGNLLELMETVCERMEDYAEQADSSTNRNSYVRIKSRTTGAMDLSEAVLDSRVTASLKFACETIVEQHEDEIIEFFAHETDNVKDKLCSKRTDLCDHALKMPHDEL